MQIKESLVRCIIAMLMTSIQSMHSMENTPTFNSLTSYKHGGGLTNQYLTRLSKSTYMETKNQELRQSLLNDPNSYYNKSEPASHRLQILGIEMQVAVGIPSEKQVPVRQLSPWPNPLNNIAFVDPTGIYVPADLDTRLSYGSLRSVMGHEAIHVEYNDAATITTLNKVMNESFKYTMYGVLTGSVVSYLTLHYTEKRNPHQFKMEEKKHGKLEKHGLRFFFGVTIANLGVGLLKQNIIRSYRSRSEERADTLGLLNTNCTNCVREFSVYRGDKSSLGYLSKDETQAIESHLKKEKKICNYHANRLD
jgi:hypothetical protein